MSKYCLIHKPTGQICELERDKAGALVCFMSFDSIEAAHLAANEYGVEEYAPAQLPADIVAFADPENRLPYYHPFCKAAEAAWFDLYEKSEDLQALDDRALSIAADYFTEGYIVALRSAKKEG
jgi:hypothetical protein